MTNVTLRELDLPDIGKHADAYWRLSELRPGVLFIWPSLRWQQDAPDLTDCLAERLPGRPWLLQVWEPLLTKAPSPARAMPHCCYLNTVIFYHRPYVVASWGHPFQAGDGWDWQSRGDFLQYDKIKTRLRDGDIISFDDDLFQVALGRVVWKYNRWWMFRTARRAKGQVIGIDQARQAAASC